MSAPQIIIEQQSQLNSPIEVDGAVYVAAQNGEIIQYKDGQQKTFFHVASQPHSIKMDNKNKVCYVANMARQCIQRFSQDENNDEIIDFINEFEGMPLLGPNSILLSPKNNMVFFTDSGPFGETAIDNCKGSLFAADLDNLTCKALALYCLSFPSGICMGNDQKTIYLCETGKNRILRFVQANAEIYYFSVYIQFQGRFGPMACAVSSNDLLYVARYEFSQVTDDGLISIYNQNGINIDNIVLPQYPELTGMTFSVQKPGVLYITENSQKGKCLQLNVTPSDKKDKDKFK
ncbi:unnamed protein product (macronuclear) [Paramecium tetraurelia]|uniref:SMP-30/Gluconolactonase/LRE-like region domain-containing protein n=1 Tax=Paramecium tetraurelia TaxID=5888 RepID=A0DM27_PARTE|nr:uncharacterized protein GSPATT00018312001 [Paramecium tetraurelia]CAK84094.1 unnamed protein product [Paramecium tetraurelia]|eukprot:XP_001451491.1 hypothetical protein (macronuclear) [Paramecium tetraurelia strain d4-2]